MVTSSPYLGSVFLLCWLHSQADTLLAILKMAFGSFKLKRSVDLTIQEGELPIFLLVPGFDLDWPSLGHVPTPNFSEYHGDVTHISLAWVPRPGPHP